MFLQESKRIYVVIIISAQLMVSDLSPYCQVVVTYVLPNMYPACHGWCVLPNNIKKCSLQRWPFLDAKINTQFFFIVKNKNQLSEWSTLPASVQLPLQRRQQPTVTSTIITITASSCSHLTLCTLSLNTNLFHLQRPLKNPWVCLAVKKK